MITETEAGDFERYRTELREIPSREGAYAKKCTLTRVLKLAPLHQLAPGLKTLNKDRVVGQQDIIEVAGKACTFIVRETERHSSNARICMLEMKTAPLLQSV